MDLALLQQMKEQTHRLASNRRDTSGDAYEQGLACLARAQASDFEDKEALKQASAHLIKAIQYGRRNVEAYVAMGYLLILLGDHMMAIRYLNEGRRIDPQNSDLQTLIDFVQNPQAHSAQAEPTDDFGLVALDGEEPADDSGDELFEAVQNLIDEQVAQLRQIRWQVALTPQTLKALEDQYMQLEQNRTELEARFAELELEMDTTSLRQRARPLENAGQKLQSLRQSSARLLRVVHQMQTLNEQVQQDLPFAQANKAAMEQKLEQYLDACDGFADILEQTENEGYSIDALESPYNKLVSSVEQLQDLLDA
jgi:DNA repair exonuclease SbcCD ATPase subunit